MIKFMKASTHCLPMSVILRENNIPLSARKINQVLFERGYLLRMYRQSMKNTEKMKSFYVLSGKGLEYGVNVKNRCHPIQTEPRYNTKKILPLICEISDSIYDRV